MADSNKVLNDYKPVFRHLRLLKGIHNLTGQMIVEAETPDGRYLREVVSSSDSSNDLKRVLEQWSPREVVNV